MISLVRQELLLQEKARKTTTLSSPQRSRSHLDTRTTARKVTFSAKKKNAAPPPLESSSSSSVSIQQQQQQQQPPTPFKAQTFTTPTKQKLSRLEEKMQRAKQVSEELKQHSKQSLQNSRLLSCMSLSSSPSNDTATTTTTFEAATTLTASHAEEHTATTTTTTTTTTTIIQELTAENQALHSTVESLTHQVHGMQQESITSKADAARASQELEETYQKEIDALTADLQTSYRTITELKAKVHELNTAVQEERRLRDQDRLRHQQQATNKVSAGAPTNVNPQSSSSIDRLLMKQEEVKKKAAEMLQWANMVNTQQQQQKLTPTHSSPPHTTRRPLLNIETGSLELEPYCMACSNVAASPFSGTHDHGKLNELFLPKIGMNCTCGKQDENPPNICALEVILRPWQVEFLDSLGIENARAFRKYYKHNGVALAKLLKQWRDARGLSSANIQACQVALHIWDRTCKEVLRSYQEQLRDGIAIPRRPAFLMRDDETDNHSLVSTIVTTT